VCSIPNFNWFTSNLANLVHWDGEDVPHVAADDFITKFGIFIWIIGHHLDNLAAERSALGDGHVVDPLRHDGVVVVAIQNCDLITNKMKTFNPSQEFADSILRHRVECILKLSTAVINSVCEGICLHHSLKISIGVEMNKSTYLLNCINYYGHSKSYETQAPKINVLHIL